MNSTHEVNLFSVSQMAEAVVSVALETIRIVVQEVKFYYGVRSHVGEIQQELQRMRSFLKDADSKQETDERVRNMVAEVREAAYNIEDSILVFFAVKIASRNCSRKSRFNIFKKMSFFLKEFVDTHRVGYKIADIKSKIIGLRESLQTYGIQPTRDRGDGFDVRNARDGDLMRSYSHVVEQDIVGLEENVNVLVAHLIDEQKDGVVSICGMGGLGKTTIARMLYNHRIVRRHFDGFAWTCVSRQWDKKDILQGLLIDAVPNNPRVIPK